MIPTINSISIVNLSKVRINTTGMRKNALYTLLVQNVTDSRYFIINPAHDTLNFTGSNTQPTLVTASCIDSTHVDVIFDKDLDPSMAEIIDNYFITPTTSVIAAALQIGLKTVRLTTALLASGIYSIAAFNIVDTTSNFIDLAHCTAAFVVP